MFHEINKRTVTQLLEHVGAFAKDSLRDVPLCLYSKYYRIHNAYQDTLIEDNQDHIGQLDWNLLPPVPDDKKVTVIVEMTNGCTIPQMDEIQEWVHIQFGVNKLERFEAVSLYDEPLKARITVIYHDAERRRSFHSDINCQSRHQREMDIRIAGKLDAEMSRNEEVGAAIALDVDDICDMMIDHHFLWTDVANTTGSVSDIVKRFRPEIERTMKEFDVSGLILFVEVDNAYTTMGEVESLKQYFAQLVGEGVDIAINVRTRDSYIKSVTCRATLIGSPKYVKGEVFHDYGRYEILLFESENKERGHVIVASYEDEEFTLSRYDWGEFDRNRSGQTDDHHYFDKESTAKLFASLQVKKPVALLRTIRRRFALTMPSSADSHLLAFCRKEGITYKSDYHY